MASDNNPYMPPAEDAPLPVQSPSDRTPNLASTGQRLITFILDQVLVLVVAFIIGLFRGLQPRTHPRDDGDLDQLVAYIAFALYYVVCEATTGRTLGKLVMGTKVVTAAGGTPTFSQVVIRSIVRFVPFDPFSFLFGRSGWHDRWSGTRVVRVRA